MGQLLMKFKGATGYPIPALPEGYRITTLDPENDSMGWIEACADGLGTGNMTPADFQKQMLDAPGIEPERIFLIKTPSGQVVATATAWPSNPKQGYLHMVAALPEMRGQRLGLIIVQKVMDWFAENGVEDILLHTDDFRLAAIKTYLHLGFLPVISDFDMRERWLAVFEKLGVETSVYRVELHEEAL